MDRVEEILQREIDNLEKQLAFVRAGITFTHMDGQTDIPITEEGILEKIARLQVSIERNRANAATARS